MSSKGEIERLKMKTIDNYKKKLKTFTTDDNLGAYLPKGKENIMKYSDLNNYNLITDLLPNDKDFKVILVEEKENSGHWTCLMRYGDTVEYFDPYGVKVDGEFKFIPKVMRKLLGENDDRLTYLMKTDPKLKPIYNKKKFQQLNDNIATCGRHCICRINLMKMGYTLPEYIDFMERTKEDYGKPFDIIVCDFTKEY